jgi:DNA-binding response OmpR family regulator
MRILIIEDEEKLARSLKRGLESDGYTVDYVLDGDAGQRRLELYGKDYDLVILDLMMPKKDGFEVCRNIRAHNITTPILVLTARESTDDKVRALDAGADDYLVKPFSVEELRARMRALLRRPEQVLPTELHVGSLVLNPATRKVLNNGEEVALTLKEFNLLEYFMRNPGRVLTREQIYDNLWDFVSNSFSNVIDVYVKNLRQKIGNDERGTILETVRGVGYRLRAS